MFFTKMIKEGLGESGVGNEGQPSVPHSSSPLCYHSLLLHLASNLVEVPLMVHPHWLACRKTESTKA